MWPLANSHDITGGCSSQRQTQCFLGVCHPPRPSLCVLAGGDVGNHVQERLLWQGDGAQGRWAGGVQCVPPVLNKHGLDGAGGGFSRLDHTLGGYFLP